MTITWPAYLGVQPIHPLAIGAGREILAHCDDAITPDERDMAVRAWTGQPAYLGALMAGGERIALDGSPAGSITEGERGYAARRLKALKERRKATEKR